MRLQQITGPIAGYPEIMGERSLPYWKTTDPATGEVFSYFDWNNYYVLANRETDVLYQVGLRLYAMCLAAGDYIIKNNLFEKMSIPQWVAAAIIDSWNEEQHTRYAPSFYGRFDIRPVLNERGEIVSGQLFEYNAQTPTSIPETAVTQYDWFCAAQEAGVLLTTDGIDQWNPLGEALIERMVSELTEYQKRTGRKIDILHFAYCGEEAEGEDFTNVEFLRLMAEEAAAKMGVSGQPAFRTRTIRVEDIGYFREDGSISLGKVKVDDSGGLSLASDTNLDSVPDRDFFWEDPEGTEPIERVSDCFMLYPLEQMVWDDFGPMIIKSTLRDDGITLIEPSCMMMWSTKALLPILTELFWYDETRDERPKFLTSGLDASEYPELGDVWTLKDLIIPAYFEGEQPPDFGTTYVRKPVLAREGAGVEIIKCGRQVVTEDDQGYGEEGFVVQRYAPLPVYRRYDDGQPAQQVRPVIGLWMVKHEPVALGIRHDGEITTNRSRFAPHVVLDDNVYERIFI